jgi:MYXO-CTERM domain-containing protein
MGSKFTRWLFGALAGLAMMVAAPRAAEAALVGFCTFSDAGQLQGLQMNGSARAPAGVLFLTPNLVGDNGSAYLKTPVNLSASTNFQTHFIFRMYFNSTDPAGGSGLAFVMQNKAPTALSGSGTSLGLNGVGPSVAVEFDTAQDNNTDPNANHVAIIEDGDTKKHLATATPAFNMKNGTDTHVWIDYDAATTTLRVFMAQNGVKPATALLTHVINLYATVDALGAGNKMFIGFSASTGQQTNQNNQDISYWVFANDGTPLTDCVTCTNANQCVGTPSTPVCNNDPGQCAGTVQDPCFCVQCTPTQQGQCVGTPNPVCNPDTNTCVECNDDSHCGGTKPVCLNHACVPCENDNGGAQPACNVATRPVCQKPPSTIAGACTQCSGSNATQCTGSTPVCLPDVGTCGCTADNQCPTGNICVGTPGVCQPGCRANGTVPCTGGATCVATDAGDGSGTCVQGCDPNANNCTTPTPACVCPGGGANNCVCVQCDTTHPCPSPQLCNAAGQCVQCTPQDVTNCDPTGTGGICRPNGQCGCNTDPDCGGVTSGRVCDDTNKVCKAGCRGTGGNGCPTGQRCTSTTNVIGQCVTDPGDAGVDSGIDSGTSSSGGSSGTTSSSGGSSGASSGGSSGINTDAGIDNINIEGGGCNCTMVPGGGALPAGALALATMASLALMRRRRKK